MGCVGRERGEGEGAGDPKKRQTATAARPVDPRPHFSLEPAVIEVERERECVCVVAHQAILRALYGYFTKTPLKVVRGGGKEVAVVDAHGSAPPPPFSPETP